MIALKKCTNTAIKNRRLNFHVSECLLAKGRALAGPAVSEANDLNQLLGGQSKIVV